MRLGGGIIGGFSDEDLLGGTEESRARAREALRRQQRLEIVRKAGWPELKAKDLVFLKVGLVEHRPTGRFYRQQLGEIFGAGYDTADAYYLVGDDVVLLERPTGGPQTRQELEDRRAGKGAA